MTNHGSNYLTADRKVFKIFEKFNFNVVSVEFSIEIKYVFDIISF